MELGGGAVKILLPELTNSSSQLNRMRNLRVLSSPCCSGLFQTISLYQCNVKIETITNPTLNSKIGG